MAIHKKFSKIAGLALMLALFVLSFANYATAVGEEENVRVILNGAELTFDVPAQIINGRTMVPMRGIFEALGAQIGWDDATNTVTAAKGDTKITLAIGDSVAYKNGAAVALDVPALIVDSRSLAPLRFVGEALGAQVEWSEETRTVRIVSSDTTAPAVAEEDLDSSWDSAATKINLNQSSVSIDGAGATAAGSVVTITEAGTYVVSGSLLDGQIAVAATKDDLVRIVLNSADITNGKGAPIDASKCGKLILILAAGTQNNLTDGGTGFAYRDEAEQEPNAAVFAKNDLTINGTGALTVNAGFNNGIGAKDNLLVVSGAIAVNAANHGLRGNDSVTVLGGDLNIRSGNDGIQTNNEEDADKGWIAIAGGAVTIVSGHDGIQADTNLRVSGGEFHVTAGGGVSEAQTITSSDSTSDSYKGMKATGDVVITEGRFAIDSADDAVHANGSIYISGGEFALSTGDDGVHADKELNVDGGNITVTKSYEGLEAANINISGGIANIVASDDGINAAGGSDGNMEGGRFGGDNFSASNGYSINISGGNVTVQANGDGLDSNGSIKISGGNVVSLINAKGDGAIDANGTIEFTGGTIIYGGTGIGGAPSGNSTQSYVYMDVNVPANSEISVQNSGKTLIAFTPFLDCRYLVLSSPDIKSGESYEIYSGAVLITAATAGTGGAGMGGGGMGGAGMGSGGMGGGGTSSGGMGGGGMGGGERQPPNMNRQRPE